MQIQVHQRRLVGCGHDLVPIEGILLQKLLLGPIQLIVLGISQERLGSQEEPAAATAGIRDRLHWLRTHALHHGADQGPGCEVLPCPALDILRVLLQELLIDDALDVGGHGNPPLPVDHLYDTVEDGDVADLIDSPLEDLAQDAALLAELLQGGFILDFQLRAPQGVHIRPGVALGNARIPIIGRTGILIGHLQEQQIRQLLQIIAIGYPVIPQGIAHGPDFRYDGGCLIRHGCLFPLELSC